MNTLFVKRDRNLLANLAARHLPNFLNPATQIIGVEAITQRMSNQSRRTLKKRIDFHQTIFF